MEICRARTRQKLPRNTETSRFMSGEEATTLLLQVSIPSILLFSMWPILRHSIFGCSPVPEYSMLHACQYIHWKCMQFDQISWEIVAANWPRSMLGMRQSVHSSMRTQSTEISALPACDAACRLQRCPRMTPGRTEKTGGMQPWRPAKSL